MDHRNIGFSLKGRAIPFKAFNEASRNLLDLLVELDVSVSGKQNLDWEILELKTGSAELLVKPILKRNEEEDYGDEIISSALRGFGLIEQEPTRPDYFTDRILKKAKEFGLIANGKVECVIVSGKATHETQQSVSVTQRIAENVDKVIGTSSVALGAVEGVLETLTVHERPTFAIYDVIASRRIECICDRETLDKLLLYLEKRLLVKGEVRFNVGGEPTSVKVESFRLLEDEDLPQAKDIRGLFSEDKVSIDEWSQFVRNK